MTDNSNQKPRSLLDIQAEQQREQQQGSGRGGSRGGGRQQGGGGRRQPQSAPSSGNRFAGLGGAGPGGSGGGSSIPENRHLRRGQSATSGHSSGGGGSRHGGGGYGSNSSNRGGNRGGGGGGRRGGGRGQQQVGPEYFEQLPLEHGVICTMRESFGFIHCADRPEEVFFHYSHCVTHSNDLNVDDEVEFRIGKSEKDARKMAAFCVTKVPTGTVVWETPVLVEDSQSGAKSDEKGKLLQKFRGLVERPTRFERGNTVDGTIRLLVEKEATKEEKSDEGGGCGGGGGGGGNSINKEAVDDASSGPLICFTNADYPNQGRRLSKGDLVEFTMVIVNRDESKRARNITLLLSERERQKQEAERRMLENATEEVGVVTALKGEYGFLRSNQRREEVYFHYSAVSFHEDDDPDVIKETDSNDIVLKEGQEMKFLVVDETPGAHAQNQKQLLRRQQEEQTKMPKRLSARMVMVQPRGSVKFHDFVARGVTGRVVRCPQPIDSGHKLETKGKIALEKPIITKFKHPPKDGGGDGDGESGEVITKTVTEIYLSSANSPGGTFAYRGGSSVATWVQPGDLLLFDVVQDYVDGACHAEPTKYLVPNPSESHKSDIDATTTATNDDDDEDNDNDDPAIVDMNGEKRIKLIDLSLVGRAEGEVNAVRESYGFIHFAERPVDVHFKLFQLLPDHLQEDLRRNLGYASVDDKGKPLRLSIGTECQFDISVHGTIHPGGGGGASPGMGGGRGGGGRNTRRNDHERENLKAQRILLLPPGTIKRKVQLEKCVRGTIVKEDPKQVYAGMVELEVPTKHMTYEQRHPLVAKMIDTYLACTTTASSSQQELEQPHRPLVYHDIQSMKEDEVVIAMLESHDKQHILSWEYLPHSGDHRYPGRICIHKFDEEYHEEDITEGEGGGGGGEEEAADATAATEEGSATATADGGDEAPATGGDDSKSAATSSSGGDLGDDGAVDDSTTPVKTNGPKKLPWAQQQDTPQDQQKALARKKVKPPKIVKSLRYDKASFVMELRDEAPPSIGDIMEFDITQSRRTGQVSIENMRIVERKSPAAEKPASVSTQEGGGEEEAKTSGVIGVVKEVVAARGFGFISVFDETAANREILFFNLSNVATQSQQTKAARKKNKEILRRGDEVKFDIAIDPKNGKRQAMNITVLPRGTIPSKAEENACKGLILLEPSYTSLKTQTGGAVASNNGQTGRWRTTTGSSSGDESTPRKKVAASDSSNQLQQALAEQGCMLLLEDPANMFAPRRHQRRLDKKLSNDTVDSVATPVTDGEGQQQADATGPATTIAEDEENEPSGSCTSAGDNMGTGDSEVGKNADSAPSALLTHLRYKTGALAIQGTGACTATDDSSNPKRGDLVSFVRAKGAKGGLRDIRIVSRGAATFLRGRLENIQLSTTAKPSGGGIGDSSDAASTTKDGDGQQPQGQGKATFIAANAREDTYDISLSEVVSCDPSLLKEKESVEGILYDGHIYGVCRTCDLYLETKLGGGAAAGFKERPKLNLTVKKDRGGTIMAQSMMAKGPDGTNGFAMGWTTRTSKFAAAAAAAAEASAAKKKQEEEQAKQQREAEGKGDSGNKDNDAGGKKNKKERRDSMNPAAPAWEPSEHPSSEFAVSST